MSDDRIMSEFDFVRGELTRPVAVDFKLNSEDDDLPDPAECLAEREPQTVFEQGFWLGSLFGAGGALFIAVAALLGYLLRGTCP